MSSSAFFGPGQSGSEESTAMPLGDQGHAFNTIQDRDDPGSDRGLEWKTGFPRPVADSFVCGGAPWIKGKNQTVGRNFAGRTARCSPTKKAKPKWKDGAAHLRLSQGGSRGRNLALFACVWEIYETSNWTPETMVVCKLLPFGSC